MYKHTIILAGGKGTRMNVDAPKCAIKLCGKPMAQYLVEDCLECSDDVVVVVGYKKEEMINAIKGNVKFAVQTEQLGTGHAVKCAKNSMSNFEGITIILPGDMPLVGTEIINEMINTHEKNKNALTVVTTVYDDPQSYGRIYRENGLIKKIVEFKDCSDEQKKIKEINSGLFCVDTKILFAALDKVQNNNSQHEYYLTDIVEIIGRDYRVDSYIVNDDYHLTGINDMDTLLKVEKLCLLKNN